MLKMLNSSYLLIFTSKKYVFLSYFIDTKLIFKIKFAMKFS